MWGAARVTNIAVALTCVVGAVSCSSSDDTVDPSGEVVAEASIPDVTSDADVTSDTVAGPASEEADVELLAAALLTPTAVGVPDTWAVRDLDAEVPAELLASDDVELAFGVVDCPLGPPATGADGPWLRRRFAAPADPLDNGLLAVEIVAEVQDDDAFVRRLADIDACIDERDGGSVTVESQRRSDTSSAGVVLTVGAAPSATVAFPSRHAIVFAHADQRTVTVAFSGIDQQQDWSTDAAELADRVLGLLAD